MYHFTFAFVLILPVTFPKSCVEDGELKYLPDAKELGRPERNTLTVSFQDLEEHSTRLANVIQEHYYRLDRLCYMSVHVGTCQYMSVHVSTVQKYMKVVRMYVPDEEQKG